MYLIFIENYRKNIPIILYIFSQNGFVVYEYNLQKMKWYITDIQKIQLKHKNHLSGALHRNIGDGDK